MPSIKKSTHKKKNEIQHGIKNMQDHCNNMALTGITRQLLVTSSELSQIAIHHNRRLRLSKCIFDKIRQTTHLIRSTCFSSLNVLHSAHQHQELVCTRQTTRGYCVDVNNHKTHGCTLWSILKAVNRSAPSARSISASPAYYSSTKAQLTTTTTFTTFNTPTIIHTATTPTIFALSSGRGVCGVAVIRVSGPAAGMALTTLGRFPRLPQPRRTVLRTLNHPHTGEALDKALVIWFPGPRSFTGEDSCELQVHGGTAVVTGVLEALGALPGLTPAAPGDFTKRAFSHGRLDLTEVEGLADLIHAETEAQRRQALRQMDGALSRLYHAWRVQLVKCAANISAFIDFSEDELIEDEVMDDVIKSVHSLRKEFELHLMDGRRGERLREGVHVAIIGEPNVGKSSILNALCGRPAAIVSPAAGTTRDIVESAVNLGGYPVLLSDTAGLRDTTDGVEQEGVRRAKDRAVHADIRVIVIDARKLVPSPGEQRPVLLDAYLGRHLAELGFTNPLAPGEANTQAVSVLNTIESGSCREQSDEPLPVVLLHPSDTSADPAESILVVFNKCDLVDHGAIRDVIETRDDSLHWTCLSCVTEEGMGAFTELLTVKVKQMCGNPSSGKPSLTQSRHRHHLEACLRCLDSFLQDQNADLVVAGEHLRRAVYQMGKLTGKITSDEILDVVFRDFCIGK